MHNLALGPPVEGALSGDIAPSAPCLATVFSRPFRVYSAKKFPGVMDSTPLSKAFARQGVKISIRKDPGDDGDDSGSTRGNKRKRGQADNAEDDDEDRD